MNHRKRKGQKYRLIIDGKPTIGIYIRCEYFSLNKRNTMPVFKVGRKFVRGYECFWLPLKIAVKLEKEASEIADKINSENRRKKNK